MSPDVAVLAGAWGAVAATPVVVWSRRRAVAARLPNGPSAASTVARVPRPWGAVGRVAQGLAQRRTAARGEAALAAVVPGALDLLVAAIGAGCTPSGVVELAARWGPPPVADAFAEVQDATELGSSLPDALDRLRTSTPLLAPMADVLAASAELGAPATGALVRLADEARAESRRRAETRARVLPVKLLFPLVFLVLPAFGLLTVAPAVLSALARL